MCGPANNVLGVNKDIVIRKFKTNLPVRFEVDENDECEINGCIFEIDEKSGKCVDVQRIKLS